MNEAQAKTKWCPESRVESMDQNDGSRNRDWKGEPIEGSLCLGHRCMAFVLDREAYENALYAYEESRGTSDGANVISLVGSKAPAPQSSGQPVAPQESDFYKCGKVFPDIM